MVQFAGFEMPVQYSSILEEHAAVRERAGLFDVSHMGQIELGGPAAIATAEHLLSRPVASLAPGRVRYGLLCNPEGGVIDDVTFYRLAPDALLLCVNAANIEKDWRWIARHSPPEARRSQPQRRDRPAGAPGAARGARAGAASRRHPRARCGRWAFARLAVAGRPALVSRTGYTGSDGFEIYIASGDLVAVFEALLAEGGPLGLIPVGLGARDTLRLEAAMPLYGHELDETTSPLRGRARAATSSSRAAASSAPRRSRGGAQAGDARTLVGFELLVPRGCSRRIRGGPWRPDRRPRHLGRALPYPREIHRAGLRSARPGRRGHLARDPDSGARLRRARGRNSLREDDPEPPGAGG